MFNSRRLARQDGWTWPGAARYPRSMRYAAFLLCLLPLACGPGMPDLDNRLTAQSQAADFPRLVPLGPLLAANDAAPAGAAPRAAAREGASLEARVANLQRRAAWLRNLPL